jgi:hypothetical protein
MVKKSRNPEFVPNPMQPVYQTVTGLTDAFFALHLDSEYAEHARKLAAALCRKRPSSLARGKPETWAAGIVHALGSVNFLFDRSQKPYMIAGEIAEGFGVSPRHSLSWPQGQARSCRYGCDLPGGTCNRSASRRSYRTPHRFAGNRNAFFNRSSHRAAPPTERVGRRGRSSRRSIISARKADSDHDLSRRLHDD